MVRFKNRWFLVEFISCRDPNSKQPPVNVDSKQIWAALKQCVLKNFGETGWGCVATSLNVKYYSPRTKICIVRVARDHYRIAWAAISLLTNLGGESCVPHVVHISGTIKHVQLAAIKHDREVIARALAREAQKATSTVAARDEDYLQQSAAEINALAD